MYRSNFDRIKSTQWQDHHMGKSINCFILKGAQYIYVWSVVKVQGTHMYTEILVHRGEQTCIFCKL